MYCKYICKYKYIILTTSSFGSCMVLSSRTNVWYITLLLSGLCSLSILEIKRLFVFLILPINHIMRFFTPLFRNSKASCYLGPKRKQANVQPPNCGNTYVGAKNQLWRKTTCLRGKIRFMPSWISQNIKYLFSLWENKLIFLCVLQNVWNTEFPIYFYM